jgi:hypothetical protein
MKLRWWSPRASVLFWLLLFTAYAVAAVGIVVIDARNEDYGGFSKVATTTIHATEEMRNLGAAQLAAVHRARSGAPFTSLPPGSTVRIVWPDGSSEYVVIVNPASSDGVLPIPGTQRAAEGEEDAEAGAAARDQTIDPVAIPAPARSADGSRAQGDY